MKLNHIGDVLVVAELGSLRAASRHLSVSQPLINADHGPLIMEL